MIDLVNSLNPAQRAAVTHMGGPLMIIAGAGTGKTRVITYRIAYLSREVGIPLNQILAVTFTNKAAREMRERVCRILQVPDTPGLAISTFHARCAMILRRDADAAGLDSNFAILDENDQKQAIKRVMKEMDISDKRVKPGQVQSFINQAKMKLLTPKDTADLDEDEIPYPAIYAKYQEVIEKAKSLDFEDLMMRTVQLFQNDERARLRWSERYKYVLVDEYQDTNHAQFLLSKLLAQDHKQICIVGDEDQSIYSWRGAEISNLLEFETSFPGTTLVKLEHNYRSTGNILKAASTIIAHNTQRIGKELFTSEPEGDTVTFWAARDQEEEARRVAQECTRLISIGVDPDEVAIFYRGHWLSRAVEDQMRQFRIPYRVVGGLRFYDRAEIKDLLSFMRLAVNPHDDLAMERVLNRPTRGIGAKAQQQIEQAAAVRQMSWFGVCISLLNEGAIKGTAKKGLDEFVSAIGRWNATAQNSSAGEVLDRIIADTDYKNAGVGDPHSIEGESKIENIDEFRALVGDYKASGEQQQTAEFLSSMALDATEEKDDTKPKVNLLTIHNAKGLEFLHVFVVGLEKGVFPTSRSEESHEEYAVEEERRLFYVAITRARKKLHLLYSYQRNRPDFWSMTQPSRFLGELPPAVFDEESRKSLRRLLPYGWGEERALGGSKAKDDLEYTDANEVVSRGSQPPRAFSQFTRGFGSGSAPPRVAPSSKPQFHVGMRVVHRLMGSGLIVEMGGRTGWERVMVEFDDGRSQEFVLKYAPISPEPAG
ncbi:UvrD-helicase domain-containing protein [soil metagenome]